MVILIVGNSEIERRLEQKFAEEGHRAVRAADAEEVTKLLGAEEKLDMLVLGGAAPAEKENGGITAKPDWERVQRLYAENAAGALCAVQKTFPCLERGTFKRICYLNPVCGSINACLTGEDFGMRMSACAVNMQVTILYNRMRPLGYTFRLFGVREEADCERQASAACWYFTRNRSVDAESARHTDENRLVMRDMDGREIPF